MSQDSSPVRSVPGPIRLFLATLGLAALALLWNGFAMVALLTPPAVGLVVVALVLALFLVRNAPRGTGERAVRRRADFRVRPWVRGHGRVAALAALMVPLQVSLVTLLMVAGWVDGEEVPKFLSDYLARPWGWTVLVAFAVVIAPVVEEFFFRGRMQGMLERRLGAAQAIGVTALVFTLAHFQLEGLLNRFVGGLVLGVAVYATRTVWAGVAIHATWNLGVTVLSAVVPEFEPLGKGLAWGLPAALVLALSVGGTWWVARRLLAECRGARPLGRRVAAPEPSAGAIPATG